jgi:tetratricopeptide (TPR) repeat protein
MTDLDDQITKAISTIPIPGNSLKFNAQEYIQDFHQSAQEKAMDVIKLIEKEDPHFSSGQPVFISVGGGDGEELLFLLNHTRAICGILIEQNKILADIARERSKLLRPGKTMTVIEGDASKKIHDAMEYAIKEINDKKGNFIAVTCHAVIHELFDRSEGIFDPASFFAAIFSNEDIPTLFTYREPGVPEKWPTVVLLEADCSASSLLKIATIIKEKHHNLKILQPEPVVLGDGLRANRVLAMEIIVKLFYLRHIGYEIQERSTAVDHSQLASYLWLALGDKAKQEGRATINTISAPTISFKDHWRRLKINVQGVIDASRYDLPIPESQTRVIAWRLPRTAQVLLARDINKEIELAEEALRVKDDELLKGLLISRGRSWVEATIKPRAIKLFQNVKINYQQRQPVFLWSHYFLGLDQLFSGEFSSNWFSEELEHAAESAGIALLYKAERMESLRKLGDLNAAVDIANDIISELANKHSQELESDIERYVAGTTHFLVANLLRLGGLYGDALSFITKAESIFKSGIASHDDELVHSYYARAICLSIAGASPPRPPIQTRMHTKSMQFSNALISLTDSHASWIIGNNNDARNHAIKAATTFEAIGAKVFSRSAYRLSKLLEWWEFLINNKDTKINTGGIPYGNIVAVLIGQNNDYNALNLWFSSQRPSEVIGILQFARNRKSYDTSFSITLPRTLTFKNGSLQWRETINASSLSEADRILREYLAVPMDRIIPLLTDSEY